MAVHNLLQGTRSASLLTMGTLANGTYITSAAVDLTVDIPLFVTLQVEADANGTPSGNKQLPVFVKWSLDGTDYTSGPESGTSATEEADLHWVGTLPMNDTNVHRKEFLVYPRGRYMKVVVKNDCGVALTSGAVYQAAWTGETT